MKRVVLALIVVAGAACTGNGDSAESSVSSSLPTATAPGDPTATTSVAVQQPGELPPEALDELGATQAPETGGESTGRLGETELDLDSEDGSIQIGSAELPVAAAGFPVPGDIDLQLASETAAASGFSGTSQLSVDDLAEFYRTSLPDAGFTVIEERAPTPTVVLIEFEGASARGDIALSGAPGGGGTTVIVTLTSTG